MGGHVHCPVYISNNVYNITVLLVHTSDSRYLLLRIFQFPPQNCQLKHRLTGHIVNSVSKNLTYHCCKRVANNCQYCNVKNNVIIPELKTSSPPCFCLDWESSQGVGKSILNLSVHESVLWKNNILIGVSLSLSKFLSLQELRNVSVNTS